MSERKDIPDSKDDDYDFTVTNLDDGSKYNVNNLADELNTVKLDELQSRQDLLYSGAAAKDGEEEEETGTDAKSSLWDSDSKMMGDAGVQYQAVSIPDGARLNFVRISAVGTTRDSDDKAYSVYYLDVRCSIAAPNSWFVYRRYSQFRRLSDALRSEGYFVPVLPPKQLLGTFSMDFVKQRKNDLERWLHGLYEQFLSHEGAKDPQKSMIYRRFLTEDANLPPLPLVRVFPEHSAGSESKHDGNRTGKKIGIEDFELVKVIGKGSFGKVTLVRKKADQRLYAMKVLSKANIVKRRQVEHTKTERRVLSQISHPFVVKLHYAFQSEEKLYFVLDYAAGGELFFHLSRMKKFSDAATKFYCAELTLALEAIHAHDVIYRDLKPENILLDSDGHIKLVDFGLAKEGVSEPAEGANSLCGTPEYLSPEVLNRDGHGTAVDWWNLGMVTYEMLTGLPPWYTNDRDKLYESIRSAPLKFPMSINRTSAVFIQALLNRDPSKRLGSSGAQEVKNHKFFKNVDWQELYNKNITPPFNPCKGDNITANFEAEFTNMAINSVDKNDYKSAADSDQEVRFLNFTYEEESLLESAAEEHRRESYDRYRRK